MPKIARSKIEKINQAMFDISNAVNTTFNINDLFVKIHHSLNEIIDASIFLIATYDSRTKTVSFPYYIDPVDHKYYVDRANHLGHEFSYHLPDTKGSMTGLVISTGKPLLMTKSDLLIHCEKVGTPPSGKPPEVWLGVPLNVRGQLIGVMAVQSYEREDQYDQTDIKIMSLISEQVALSIERKRNEDRLIESENRYRNLVENITDIIYTTNLEGRINFISSPLEMLTGIAPKRVMDEEDWRRFSPKSEPNAQLFSSVIYEPDRDQADRVIQEAVLSRQAFQLEYRIVNVRNEPSWVYERGHFFETEEGEIQMEGIITDIQERKNAEQQLKQREVLITTLFEISNTVHTTLNHGELYHSIHQSLKKSAHIEDLIIALVRRVDGHIEEVYRAGNDKFIDKTIPTARFAQSVADSRRTLIFQKTADGLLHEHEQVSFTDADQTWIGIPLLGKHRLLGTLLIQSSQGAAYQTGENVHLFNTVAEQVALAIEFKQAEKDLDATRKQLIENAHKSGMADVARSTLHNVGNALNSITVATGLLWETAKSSRIPSLSRANDILRDHIDHLPEFLTQDPRGKKLLEFYLKLEPPLVHEHSELLSQLQQVTASVQQIQSLIESQQSKTDSDFLENKELLTELIMESLNMHASSFEGAQIKVIHDISSLPAVSLPKMKFLRVLAELFTNAIDALQSDDSAERQLRVSSSGKPDAVFVIIEDNGVGVQRENLTRIFQHGFTTKKDHRGFGLHHAANALAEMKARIKVDVPSAGKGARFIIEIPFNDLPPDESQHVS